jgi:hypothetical protein
MKYIVANGQLLQGEAPRSEEIFGDAAALTSSHHE